MKRWGFKITTYQNVKHLRVIYWIQVLTELKSRQ